MNGLFDGLFAGVAEAGPGMAIRATVLFVVASLVSLALAKASAAQRHLVWVAALMGAMVLPAIHAWGPEWAVWPAGMIYRYGATSERGGVATRLERTMPDDRLQVDPLSHDPVPGESTTDMAAAGVSGRVEATSPATATPAGSSRTVLLANGLAAVWLVGVIYGCLRLAVAYAGIRQLARHADPADGRTAAMIAELAAAAGIRRRVRGLVSRESIVPLTWGWLRPVVLLPAEAGSWSAERLRVVLQHELAHVSRWDALTQFVAELARSVYWFHPLSWWSLRRLRAEQEAACDDCVLAAGAAADDYAEELLAVTARLPRGAYGLHGPGVAVAMGRAGRLEERVRALLAFDRDRRPVNPWRAAAVASVFAAVATLAAIIGPAADAEDKAASSPAQPGAAADGKLPTDTNTIESLTPEQARKLAKDFPGVTVWVKSKRGKFGSGGCLPLNGLESVGNETAKALAGYAKGPLLLNGLINVSDEVAKALAEHNGPLLSLDGATTLSNKAAAALAEHNGSLSLNGLTTLLDEAAKALAKHKGFWLSLDGLTKLSVKTARALAQHTGGLSLGGLTTLSDEATKELAQHKGSLNLKALTTLSDESARVLATHRGDSLHLDGLPTLSDEAAKALAKHEGMILSLDGLKTLSDEAAKSLARHKGEMLILGDLTALTNAELAARLVRNTRGGDLTLSSLTWVSAQAAKALAQLKGQHLILNGLTTLDTDTAKALAEFKGVLTLNGLTTLAPDTATALAEFKGDDLSLNGLTSLDIVAAEALEGFGGHLRLKDEMKTKFFADNPLRPDSVRAWAVVSQGNLSAVTALDSPDSVAIAKALATRKGPLSLPNLKKISPKTLTALLQKEDVQIPLIETLELIQEPDGSPTEDFVIPERLEKRQR